MHTLILRVGVSDKTQRLLALASIATFVGVMLWGEQVLNMFRLDPGDSVYDYHRASIDDRVRVDMKICHDGECLTRLDWRCGFDNGDEEQFQTCFDSVVRSAKPWMSLDHVRKYCGNLTMEFVGESYSTPRRCKDAGGTWGARSPTPYMVFDR